MSHYEILRLDMNSLQLILTKDNLQSKLTIEFSTSILQEDKPLQTEWTTKS